MLGSLRSSSQADSHSHQRSNYLIWIVLYAKPSQPMVYDWMMVTTAMTRVDSLHTTHICREKEYLSYVRVIFFRSLLHVVVVDACYSGCYHSRNDWLFNVYPHIRTYLLCQQQTFDERQPSSPVESLYSINNEVYPWQCRKKVAK